jgi:hypothetical protein
VLDALKSRPEQGASSLSPTESADLRRQIETEQTKLRRWRDDETRRMGNLPTRDWFRLSGRSCR